MCLSVVRIQLEGLAVTFEFIKGYGSGRIALFDLLGRRLAEEELTPGGLWSWRADAAGVYFYRLTTRDFRATKKMLLLK